MPHYGASFSPLTPFWGTGRSRSATGEERPPAQTVVSSLLSPTTGRASRPIPPAGGEGLPLKFVCSDLNSPEKPVVFVVRANPEPYDVASFQNAEGSIVDTHSHRIHWTPLTHPLEVQAGMAWIQSKETV